MVKEAVAIACEGKGLVRLEDFDEFQGELKHLTPANYARLKKNMIGLGFSSPFHLWRSPADGRWKTIDGHQRRRALKLMAQEGVEIPEEFPFVEVHAPSERIAKKKILALISQYGDVQRQGLFDFMADNEIPIDYVEDTFRVPEVEMASFRAEFFDPIPATDGGKSHDETAAEGKKPKVVTCPHCGEEFKP